MELLKVEDFLRNYRIKEKRDFYLNTSQGDYDKIKSLVLEGIFKLQDNRNEEMDLEFLLHSQKTAHEYLTSEINQNWSIESLEDDFLEDEDLDIYKTFFHRSLKQNSQKLFDDITNRSRVNFQTFISCILSKEDTERTYILNQNHEYMLAIYCIKLQDQYIVQGVYNHSEKFDYLLLQQKIKSVIAKIPLPLKELKELISIYKDIQTVVATLSIDFDLTGGEDSFLKKDIKSLYQVIEDSPHSHFYSKYMLLAKLDSEMKLIKSDGNRNYSNVFDIDLDREIDASFYRQLNYSGVQNLVKEIIVNEQLNNFVEPLTELERTYIYYCLFISVYNHHQYKAAIQIGEYLTEDSKIKKHAKKLVVEYQCINGPAETEYLIKRYDTSLLPDFYSKLLDAYVKEKKFSSAYELLQISNCTSSSTLRMLIDPETREKSRIYFLENLERDWRGDICLLVTDYDYFMLNEQEIEHAIQTWFERIEKENFYKVIYKPINDHLINIIMVLFVSHQYELTVKLIDFYSKVFKKSESDFIELKNFITSFSFENEQQMSQLVVSSLQRAELNLKRLNERSHNLSSTEVSNKILKVKKTFESAGTILNKRLTEKKLTVLANVLEERLDPDTYDNIINDVTNIMKQEFDLSNINKESWEEYKERLQSKEYLGKSWDKLEKQSQTYIVIGMYLFDAQKVFLEKENSDFSASIINWCLALENELAQKIFKPYRIYCEINGIENSFTKNTMPDTLGVFQSLFGENANKNTRKGFKQFCKNVIYNELNEDEINTLLDQLKKHLSIANKEFRVKAAHPYLVDLDSAESCYDLFFPTKNLLKLIFEHYTIPRNIQ